MANKEAKVNSLGSSSTRKSRRHKNYYDQQEQQQLNSLVSSTNAGRVARFNIYETIDTPTKRTVLNRLSSSSTSKLDDLEESKRLIVDHAGQSSENQLNKLSQNRQNNYDHENQSSMNCDQLFRRRYLNDINKFANSSNNNQTSFNLRSATANQSISTNPYSEILTPTTPVPSSSSGVVEGGGVSISNYTPDGLGHYQVPPTNTNTTYAAVIHHHASPIGAPSVNDEVSQIIETRRKRTLLLLKSKEAPKASFEITSPIEETGLLPPPPPPPLPLQPPQRQLLSSTTLLNETAPIEQRPISPTVLSDYENLNTNLNLDDNNDAEPQLRHHRSLDKLYQDISQDIDQTAKDCEEEQSVVSPSESQNFNTLSIVSDILGDLSQEDHSIVNQLSQG